MPVIGTSGSTVRSAARTVSVRLAGFISVRTTTVIARAVGGIDWYIVGGASSRRLLYLVSADDADNLGLAGFLRRRAEPRADRIQVRKELLRGRLVDESDRARCLRVLRP